MASPGDAADLLASTLPGPASTRQSPAMRNMSASAPVAAMPGSPQAAAMLMAASAPDVAPSPSSVMLGGGGAFSVGGGDGAAATAGTAGGSGSGFCGGSGGGTSKAGLNPFSFVSKSIVAAKRLQRQAAATQLARTKGGHSHVVQHDQRIAATRDLARELHDAMYPYVPPAPLLPQLHHHAHDSAEQAAARAAEHAAHTAEVEASYATALAEARPPFTAVDGATATNLEKLAAVYASGGRHEECEALWAAAVAVRGALHVRLLRVCSAAVQEEDAQDAGAAGLSAKDAAVLAKKCSKDVLKAEAAECRFAMALLALARVRRQTDDAEGARAALEQIVALVGQDSAGSANSAGGVGSAGGKGGVGSAAMGGKHARKAPKPTALQASMAKTVAAARRELASLLHAHAIVSPEAARAGMAARRTASLRAGDGEWRREQLVRRLTKGGPGRGGGGGGGGRNSPQRLIRSGSPRHVSSAGSVGLYTPPRAVGAMRAELQQILFCGR